MGTLLELSVSLCWGNTLMYSSSLTVLARSNDRAYQHRSRAEVAAPGSLGVQAVGLDWAWLSCLVLRAAVPLGFWLWLWLWSCLVLRGCVLLLSLASFVGPACLCKFASSRILADIGHAKVAGTFGSHGGAYIRGKKFVTAPTREGYAAGGACQKPWGIAIAAEACHMLYSDLGHIGCASP
jgi:hypothetical protein